MMFLFQTMIRWEYPLSLNWFKVRLTGFTPCVSCRCYLLPSLTSFQLSKDGDVIFFQRCGLMESKELEACGRMLGAFPDGSSWDGDLGVSPQLRSWCWDRSPWVSGVQSTLSALLLEDIGHAARLKEWEKDGQIWSWIMYALGFDGYLWI